MNCYPLRQVIWLLAIGVLWFSVVSSLPAQMRMENLGRGVVAIRTSATQVYVGWRMLGTDPDALAFNLYRSIGGAPATKLNGAPLAVTTDYRDTPGSSALASGVSYHVRPVLAGMELEASTSFTLPPGAPTQSFLSIPIQAPLAGLTPAGENYTYSANDVAPADLDGDGEYELVVKWDPSNAKDNAQGGYTGPVYMDAYKLDGTRLWRINLGINIRAGAHYTQFIAYDLDSDGRAEVAMKTAPGTYDGLGNAVLLPGDNADADYRNGNGYILSGPEYLTVFDGLTGAALATTPYLPGRGTVSNWGDSYGNRVDRFLAGVAYLDGERPSLIMCRGYYTQSHVVAWDWREGALTRRWTFFAPNNTAYAGQGNHSLSVADVDGDGRQEIIYGAMTVNHDGTGLYTTGLGHGDALHVSDFDPSRPGLEIFSPFESPGSNGNIGTALRDAATGAILWSTFAASGSDVGRGLMMDIDSRYPGAEAWATNNANIYSAAGEVIATKPSNMFHNFGVWWDADPLRELLDGTTVSKWNHLTSGRSNILEAWRSGAAQNNGTKATPALSGDILGDWREEIVWRTSASTALLVFTTTIPATNRLRTFAHDPQYRVALAWQNVAYNQPPHPSFFVGANMAAPPMPNIRTDAIAPPEPPRLPQAVRWTGDLSTLWDSTTANFATDPTGQPVVFAPGDHVLVANLINTPVIELVGALQPASLVVNTHADLTFSGNGSFSGGATVTKRGGGRLTLPQAHSYSGGTVLEAGILTPGVAGALGSGVVTLRGGELATGVLTIQNPLIVEGSARISGGHGGGNHGIKAVSGDGVLTLVATSVFDLEGSFAGFAGRVNFTGTGSYRFFGGAGSALAEFELGTRSLNARSGSAFTLGSLSGDPGSFLLGASGGGNNVNVTYTIGTNGRDTVFGGVIANGNANTALVKNGGGRLVLAGANTYAGATTITSGALVVSGSLGNTSVLTASGATFGGSGSLAGNLTLENGARLALGVAPGLVRGPTVGGVTTLNGNVTVTAEDLGGNLGAGTFTVLTYSGTLIGTPAWQWSAPVGSPLVGEFVTETPGSIQIILTDPRPAFVRWTEAQFGPDALIEIAGPLEDPDGDGVPNLLEYALGGDPLVADAAAFVTPEFDADVGVLALVFNRIADPALTYEVEAASTLGGGAGWTVIWSSTGEANVAGPVVVEDVPGAEDQSTRFLRLRVR